MATVNQYGTVLAVGLGEAVITATSESGKTATCTITVSETPDPAWPQGKQWECTDELLDFDKTIRDYLIKAGYKPEEYSYNNSEFYKLEQLFLTPGGNFGFTYSYGDGAGGYETYVAKLGEEPNLEVFSVYEMDLETGEIRYNGSTEYTLVSPAKELTLSDVCIKLGSDVYPMWIVDELVDSHAGFMTGLMGGNPSATLPIQPIKKTGNWHTVCRMISRVLT